MKILITGSNGTIGNIIRKFLDNKRDYELVCVDKNNSINPRDILKDDLSKYFEGVEIIIHLAANPNPFINKDEAGRNVEITKKIIRYASKNKKTVKRIINASSINVYPYIRLFEEGTRISKNAPLSANKKFGNGEYGKAKIKSEKFLKVFCKKNNLDLINLRFGAVTKNDLPPKQKDGNIEVIDKIIHLKHKDLEKIIDKSLNLKGIKNFICVSSNNKFITSSIRFPIN